MSAGSDALARFIVQSPIAPIVVYSNGFEGAEKVLNLP